MIFYGGPSQGGPNLAKAPLTDWLTLCPADLATILMPPVKKF